MTSPRSISAQLEGLRAEMDPALRTQILDYVGLVDRYVTLPDGLDGDVTVAFNSHGVCLVSDTTDPDLFAREHAIRFGRPLLASKRPPAGVARALRSGRGGQIDVDLRGLSTFQVSVLEAARSIPRGEVRPYRWIASAVGRPGAVRAVGTALGRNPVPLVIPCHRVVRSDGSPGDYVFGAAHKLERLIAEDVNLDEILQLARQRVRFIGSDTTHIFCHPSCYHARKIAPSHRVLFRTVDDATRARFRSCRSCHPAPEII
jgi:O-6-methylguanine DNA methyltransferase